MILLDTNVISELMRPQPEPRVLAWADGLDPEAVAITAMPRAGWWEPDPPWLAGGWPKEWVMRRTWEWG